MSTTTSKIKELPLTAAILNEQSLDNIIENNELEQKLNDYVLTSAFKPEEIKRSAVDEALLSCYARSETSSAAEINEALGKKVEAAGRSCEAVGYESRAVGIDTVAEGHYSFAEGGDTTAAGWASHAEGDGSAAEADYSHAEGLYAAAAYDYAHAEGIQTTAACKGAHAEGKATTAGTAFKVGRLELVEVDVQPATYKKYNSQTGEYDDVLYIDGTTENYNPTGYEDLSVKWKVVIDGQVGGSGDTPGQMLVNAVGANEFMLEYAGLNQESPSEHVLSAFIEVSETRSTTVSAYNLAKLPASVMWDNRIDLHIKNGDETVVVHCFADKTNCMDVGTFFSDATPKADRAVDLYALNTKLFDNKWLGKYLNELQHAEGYGTLAHGRASHAEGEKTRAIGSISHAEGYDTTAIGHGSRVNGVHSFAEGKYATAVGKCVNAKSDYSIAAGNCVTSRDENSFAWSGDYVGHDLTNYTSQGKGTFCINPTGGLNGFYIGTRNFVENVASCLVEAINNMDGEQKIQLKECLTDLLGIQQHDDQQPDQDDQADDQDDQQNQNDE